MQVRAFERYIPLTLSWKSVRYVMYTSTKRSEA